MLWVVPNKNIYEFPYLPDRTANRSFSLESVMHQSSPYEKGFTSAKKIPVKFLSARQKHWRNFSGLEKYFWKIRTHTHPQNKISPTSQTPLKPKILRRDRNSGQPRAFADRISQKTYWTKKDALKSPLNCSLKSLQNPFFSRNNRFKRYFLLVWTLLPQKPGTRSGKRQSEPKLRPEYLMSEASGSPLPIQGFLGCQTFLWIPCEGKYIRSFRSNRVSFSPKQSPNWTNPGIGGWKTPGLGVQWTW